MVTAAPDVAIETAIPRELAGALVMAQASTACVVKAAYDKHSKYWYASADDVIDVARGVLSSVGLACISTGWSIHEQGVTVSYLLVHESGASIDISATTPCVDTRMGPAKALYASVTENLAYVLRGLLLLPRVEEPEDGAQPYTEPAQAPSPSPAAPPPARVQQLAPTPEPEPRTIAPGDPALLAIEQQANAEIKAATSADELGDIYQRYADALDDGNKAVLRVALATRGFALADTLEELDGWIPRIQRWALPEAENDVLRDAWRMRQQELEIPF